MKIYCCGCETEVEARLTTGGEIYPHRPDLSNLPFWKCDDCKNFVGCHHKTKNRTAPLGCIPTNEIKAYRKQIHRELDPIWQQGSMSRKAVYTEISKRIGYHYHTANTRTVEECIKIINIIGDIENSFYDIEGNRITPQQKPSLQTAKTN